MVFIASAFCRSCLVPLVASVLNCVCSLLPGFDTGTGTTGCTRVRTRVLPVPVAVLVKTRVPGYYPYPFPLATGTTGTRSRTTVGLVSRTKMVHFGYFGEYTYVKSYLT